MEGHPERVRDQRIDRVVPLQPPTDVLGDLPLTHDQEQTVLRGRSEIVDILRREDDRLLVVVGLFFTVNVRGASAPRLPEQAAAICTQARISAPVLSPCTSSTSGRVSLRPSAARSRA